MNRSVHLLLGLIGVMIFGATLPMTRLMPPRTLAGTGLGAGSGIAEPDMIAIFGPLCLRQMSMFGGYVFWNAGLAPGGIAWVSQVQLLQSLVTLDFSTIMLAEHVSIETIIFAAGVVLTVWAARKARIS